MRALIQKKKVDVNSQEFLNGNCYDSWDGFYQMGYEVDFFTSIDELLTKIGGDDLKETIVHGSVLAVRKALATIGVDPQVPDYPSELSLWMGDRKPVIMTFAEFCKKVTEDDFSNPLFVKPVSHKLFTGKLIKTFADLIPLAAVSDETLIHVMSPVRFISEWRTFVLRGQIVGIRNYKGDYFCIPHRLAVERMVGAFKNAPVAYSMDIGLVPRYDGLIQDTSTELVEVNDAFALGSYGLGTIKYCQMIKARWDEMVNEKR